MTEFQRENSMRQYSAYIVTTIVTFTVGLASSLLLGTNDGLFINRLQQFSKPSVSVKDRPRIVSGIAGTGWSDEGFPTSFSDHDYSDGTYVHQLSVFYPSGARATSELQKRIQTAGILRRDPVLDSDGHQIGERVVTSNGELLWTENQRLVIQKRRSVQDILNALDKSR